jgi:hypothetical protein
MALALLALGLALQVVAMMALVFRSRQISWNTQDRCTTTIPR